MDYIYVKCPICGSTNIKIISSSADGDNTFYMYECSSCDARFSSENLLKKALTKNEKKIIQNLEESLRFQNKKIEELENSKKYNSDGSIVFDKNRNCVLEIFAEFSTYISSGTGIVYKNNLVITNTHVLRDKESKSISKKVSGNFYKNSKEIKFEIKYVDEDFDFAILTPIDYEINNVSLVNQIVITGESCFAVGNAKGQGIAIFDGIIADSERIINGNRYIMFTAPVTNGNSGGPLFNKFGELIGMVTMGRSDFASMNYALPISAIENLCKKVTK